MSASQHIIEVNESDFQYEVLAHSGQRPVVVDFSAEWSIPSRAIDPILERIATEASGSFRLAKLSVDANPKIAKDYGVRGVPTVKVFRNGQVIAEFSGPRSESQIREFLKAIGPTTDDLAVGRANGLLAVGELLEAEDAFRDSLADNPDHPGALLGLAKSLIGQGRPADALPILREFPVSKEYAQAEQLTPLAQAMANSEEEQNAADEYAAIYANALRLAGDGKVTVALDGLLEILRANRNYRRGEGRKVVLGMLLLLGEESKESREYRSELASLLF